MIKMLFTLILSFLLLFALKGCISPKTDAFLLGAGIGTGVTYYFLNRGKIDGISKNSLKQTKQEGIIDASIPAGLEWYYFESNFPN